MRLRSAIRALVDRLRLENRSKDKLPPKAWLTAEEDSLVPPRSVWIGPNDPISHYYRWIWEYLAYLTVLTDLRRESAVLELGCGHGRTARGLLDYLRSPGRYVGIDVDSFRIEDAKGRLEARYPNFQFVWADVYNRQTNPSAATKAAAYRFPLDDNTFDVIYAASLFTHLLPEEAEHYFREAARVLKPHGRCLFSFFLLDRYRGPGTTISPLYVFEHPLANHEGVAVRDPECPDEAIAYREDVIERAAQDAGLRVVRFIPGLWTNSEGWAVNEQDLVVLERDGRK
jgi:SAM-dependent methyltransferase